MINDRIDGTFYTTGMRIRPGGGERRVADREECRAQGSCRICPIGPEIRMCEMSGIEKYVASKSATLVPGI